MNIVIENTSYSLFLYLLIDEQWDNSIFLLDEKLYNSVALQLKKKKFKVKKIFSSYRKNPLLFYIKKIKYLFFIIYTLLKKENVYGNDAILIFPFSYRIHLIEDGLMNYSIESMPKIEYSFNYFLKKLLRLENPFYKPYGFSSKIDTIFFSGIKPIPQEFKKKAKIIEIEKLWNKKTKKEQKDILDIFDFNYKIINIIKKRKYILFTQPLYEDGVITEAEKIEIYRKILKNYNLDDIIIKNHPREKTNYKKYFPNIEVLEQKFPAELLTVLDIKFEKAITIFSTAACTLDKNIEVDFYGTEINSKIFERFGSMDSIMKRNAFIKEE